MVRKLRVYELGRHYGVDSKQIMTLLQKMKVKVKSHMSVVEDGEVARVHSVFQRKRQLARENYAKAHNLNPDQLKNVAALKPLEKPVAVEEPETKKKKAKKKVSKKKKAPAKPKVVVIKKAGQMTKVAKKAQAARDAEKQVRAEEKERALEEKEQREAELAAKREEHAKTRIVKSTAAKLVKKADVEAREAEEAKDVEDSEETVTEDVELDVEIVEVQEETETPETSETVEASETVAEGDQDVVVEEETSDSAAAEEPAPEKESAPDDPLDKVGTKKKDGFKLGDIIKPAPKVKKHRPAQKERSTTQVSSSSVRDSIKAAIKRRQDEAAAREESTSRRTRPRKKKKKVDQAEVDRALKQTMAQMDGSGSKKKRKKGEKVGDEEVVVETAVLKLTEFITVQELADKLQVKAQELIGHLFKMGLMTTINQRLEKDNIELLVAEYEREVEFLTELGEDVLEIEEVKSEDMTDRPPVVTVMGHVDHGKTSLLDSIRKTNVIAGEAGGITQHIGAYMVQTDGGPITFLDTPGHAAFTAMRARGAQVTDLVILIVAANDGVMPQTVEAISHAKAAGVPLIVAVNKIDLEDATPDRVKQELLQHEIVVEEYGGDVLCAEISAKQGIGIEKILEQIHLQTEVLELKASAAGQARGVVVEAKKEPGRGVLFTVLVDQGTMKVGDNFLVGMTFGRVRALLDERGNKMEEVKPGEPCEILGASDVPQAGDRFYVVDNERQARDLAEKRSRLQRQQQIVSPKVVIDLDNLAELMTTGELKELPIIIKGDVAGSVEALADQLMELNTEEVQVKIVHKAVGAVSESDVLLAANTGAMIIGFHMRPGPAILDRAKANNVTIEVFDIIYEAVDTLKKAMAGLLGSIKREVSTGKASVRQVFTIPKVGSVAGSMVIDGVIKRNSRARLVRDEVMIWEGKVNSLKRFKDDVKEVQSGYECGIGLENFYEIKEDDVLECYEIEEIKRTEL
ncbi:MAG: translation initiation factor IF-2 [Candidatus Krumholzibacteria bacterium]|nr:translation initiation factor IF-2 [Candidatus Krumholzibacteria bacterium]